MDRTLTRKTRLILLLAIVACLVGCDQWSKSYAVEHWKGQPRQEFFSGVFAIDYQENDGAFLSLLATAPKWVRVLVLVVFNAAVMLGVTVYVLTQRHFDVFSFVALALIVAGGVGNLIDRIYLGSVIDFFNLGIGNLRTGVFNVADMAITTGFLMLLPMVFLGEKSPDEKENRSGAASAAGGDASAPSVSAQPQTPSAV